MTFTFRYPLNDGLLGFYAAPYTAADGTEKQLAATMFESMSARKAFPCFDEPALKVLRPPGLPCSCEPAWLRHLAIHTPASQLAG